MEVQLLKESLRKTLKLKGVTFAQMAQVLGISERSLSRMFSGSSSLTIERLAKICDHLGISLPELFEYGKADLNRKNFEFTYEQEKFLANNFNYHRFYNLIWTFDTVKELAEAYNIDDVTIGKLLSQLEKIGLLEWLPGNEAKLVEPRKYNSKNGPLVKTYGVQLGKAIVEKTLINEKSSGFIAVPNLSKNAIAKFKIKIEELFKEIKRDREIESLLKIPTESTAVLLILEPYIDFEPLRNLRL